MDKEAWLLVASVVLIAIGAATMALLVQALRHRSRLEELFEPSDNGVVQADETPPTDEERKQMGPVAWIKDFHRRRLRWQKRRDPGSDKDKDAPSKT